MKVLRQEKDFVIFDGFVENPEKVADQVRELNAAGMFQVDNVTVKGGVYLYNPPPFLKLMIQQHLKLKELGFLLEEVPTYCFLRQYLPGSSLPVHTDRDQCEMNLTFVIEGHESFHLKGKDGTVHEIFLSPNQALLYSGKNQEHWRERINGYLCVALFHFMRPKQ